MKPIKLIAVAFANFAMIGCAASGMKDVKESGFLGDYSMLQPGGDDRAALVYVKPGVDFKPYTKIMFDRVLVSLADSAEHKELDRPCQKILGEAGFTAEYINTSAEVTLDNAGDGFAVTSSHLSMQAKVPEIDESQFQEAATKAKEGCPISKLLDAEISLQATLQ